MQEVQRSEMLRQKEMPELGDEEFKKLHRAKKQRDQTLGAATKSRSVHAAAVSDNTILIKPGIDASDKEMHYRNQFSHISKNLGSFMEAAFRDSDVLK